MRCHSCACILDLLGAGSWYASFVLQRSAPSADIELPCSLILQISAGRKATASFNGYGAPSTHPLVFPSVQRDRALKALPIFDYTGALYAFLAKATCHVLVNRKCLILILASDVGKRTKLLG